MCGGTDGRGMGSLMGIWEKDGWVGELRKKQVDGMVDEGSSRGKDGWIRKGWIYR